MAFSEGRAAPEENTPVVRQRIALGRSRRRLSFERRLRLSIAAAALPSFALLLWVCRLQQISAGSTLLLLGVYLAVWLLAGSYFFDSVVRPMQTLSNIVAALRDNDFSFRARGARRGDAMGDLALEINALASTLQQQRSGALDALALADRVMTSMQSPVVAFDEENNLRLLNAAAERAFGLQRERALRQPAAEIGLSSLLQQRDESMYAHADGSQPSWSVRRAAFRLYGVPHTLFVLSDVAAALQEEERVAWQRLIRVLGHEINNSLTPIKSIASMLRARPLHLDREHHTSQDLNDMRRGLSLIEDRADSLNRFLQAYQQMSRLPPPTMRLTSLCALVERTVPLEQRLAVRVLHGVDVEMLADPDQLQQLLINLMKNGAEAALDPEAENDAPEVTLRWTVLGRQVTIQIEDNGPGLANPANLFVPFYTTKPAGAGIGLTLSRQIAAGHRGVLNLRNRVDGSGCVAEIVLPLGS
jgi:two-component system nitrogen regulation sensor histidine kinase NtrY